MPRRVLRPEAAPDLVPAQPTPDATQRRLAEAQALSARLAALNEATALLIASQGADELLHTLVQQARWVLDFQHCRLVLSGSRWCIEDLGSSNGTLVNGERIAQPRELESGDVVGLGRRARYRVHL